MFKTCCINWIEFDDLGEQPERPSLEAISFKDAKKRVIRDFEVHYIKTLLAMNKGNITRAAQQAGKHRRAFWELMKKHGIDAVRFAEP